MLSKIFLQLDYFNPFDDPQDIVSVDDTISGVVSIAIAILSIFLAIMAFSAYRKSQFPQLKFIVIAFSLFTLFLVLEATQELLPLNDDSLDLTNSVIILFILLSFFFGIMKKQRKNGNS